MTSTLVGYSAIALAIIGLSCDPGDDDQPVEEFANEVGQALGLIYQAEHERLSQKTCWLLPEWKANPERYVDRIDLVVRTVNISGGDSNAGLRLKGRLEISSGLVRAR
jgi:hypothetical protein